MRFIEPLLSLIFSNPKRKLVLTVIVSMLLQTTIFAQGNNGGLNTTSFNCRLPDVNRTNKAYSVVDDNGFYDCSCDNVVFEISGNIQSKCAQIEKDKGLLDETEFYVATYYSPIKIENVEAAKVIKEEFPDGPEGVFRRCALLFKGVAENSTDAAGYDTALSELLTAAGLTYEDAKAYYDRAITVEILKWGKKYFPNYSEQQLEKTVLPKLIAYYQNPTEPNLIEAVKEAHRSISPGAYINMVSRLDPWFGSKFNQLSEQLAYVR